jgi:hypothetical protein
LFRYAFALIFFKQEDDMCHQTDYFRSATAELEKARALHARLLNDPRYFPIVNLQAHLLNTLLCAGRLSSEQERPFVEEVDRLSKDVPALKKAACVHHAHQSLSRLRERALEPKTKVWAHLMTLLSGTMRYYLEEANASLEEIGTTEQEIDTLMQGVKEML